MAGIVYFRFNAENPIVMEIGITQQITNDDGVIISSIKTANAVATFDAFVSFIGEYETIVLPPAIYTNNSGKAYECLMKAYKMRECVCSISTSKSPKNSDAGIKVSKVILSEKVNGSTVDKDYYVDSDNKVYDNEYNEIRDVMKTQRVLMLVRSK